MSSTNSTCGERDEGDGATSIHERQSTEEGSGTAQSTPFTVNVKVNIVQFLLFIVALITRTWQLGFPHQVVFDELHYTKFVSMYMKNTFYFDTNPPLGKLLFAAVASFMGYEGSPEYETIGSEYDSQIPIYQLRLLPALCGSVVIPLIYQLVIEIGLSHWSALFAALLILFDNAMVVQTRFVLLDSIYILFMTLSILTLLKFRHVSNKPFSVKWCTSLSLTGLFLAATISTKYTGLMTYLIVVYILSKEMWKMISDRSKSNVMLLKEFLARFCCIVAVPVVIYMSVFYVHLHILKKAGPHDNVMSSAFQASLEGGLASITKGQPLHIAYGSQITLRHTQGRPCWLHSHTQVYPIKYDSGLGSSHQQQVTCYYFKDVNNWWIVKHPDINSFMVDDPPKLIRHNDIIQLVHGTTYRALNSHDVAAPVSPQCQEVSCYIDYNISMPSQNLWRVEIINRKDDSATWNGIQSIVKLHHVNTSSALKVTWKHLPDWGFKQLEVVTDRDVTAEDTQWNVEEHRYTKNSEDENIDLSHAELIPTEPTTLTFWEKFFELQVKLFHYNDVGVAEHRYSSYVTEWPFMSRNVAYWLSPNSNSQIHLIGNIAVWYVSSLSILLSIGLWIGHMMRRRRKCSDISDGTWKQFVFTLEFTTLNYIIHFLPFLLTDSTLFLHHYLPLVIFKVLALTMVIEHIYTLISSHKTWKLCYLYSVCGFVTLVIWVFIKMLPLTYGSSNLSVEDLMDLQLRESWDLIVHK